MKRTNIIIIIALLTMLCHTTYSQVYDMVVALDGTGDYTSLQAAINAVESNNDRTTVIYIKRGIYDTEKLIVPADKKNVTLVGESRDETIISYHIYDCIGGLNNKCPAEDVALWTGDNISTSATLTILGDGFRAENLTIRNTAGPVGQALAITVKSDKNTFINCNILGYQDTIYLWTSGQRTYFYNCLVLGRTDYIYGAGIGYFQECEIRSYGGGWITAPATPESQKYGFVFNQCDLTYSLGSPRSGDDGSLVALGRPWHEYPKVTWLNSNFCAEINPLGWPTTWNMDYAATSDKLELYEYNNTGPGASMDGRADWAGIRTLNPGEDTLYTIQKVLNGSDAWDPSAEPPLSVVYTWTDSSSTNSSWLDSLNWSSRTLPKIGETGKVDSGFTVVADGGTFSADLQMESGSKLVVKKHDTATYISLAGVSVSCDSIGFLTGKINSKDTISFEVKGTLTIESTLTGVKDISFNDTGLVILTGTNESYDGEWLINKGTVSANSSSAFGTGNVRLVSGANLIINNDDAIFVKSALSLQSGSSLELNANIILSELYIDGIIQEVAVYDATTNPDIISGAGSITVGRPDFFDFLGGNWDEAANFSPALIPEEGETVYNSVEMETTATIFTADIILTGTGSIRLRGGDDRNHTCTGLITMQEGSKINYATSGPGMYINAPIYIAGNVFFQMRSANALGSTMTLAGNITGSDTAFASNTRDIEAMSAVVLKGDNSGFDGVWDLTTANANVNGLTAYRGDSENALGHGTVEISHGNKLILNHSKCAGDTLRVNFVGEGKIQLNADAYVNAAFLDGSPLANGRYNSENLSDKLEGSFVLYVGEHIDNIPSIYVDDHVLEYNFSSRQIEVFGMNSEISIYSINGYLIDYFTNKTTIDLQGLNTGVYIIRYIVDGEAGTLKIVR